MSAPLISVIVRTMNNRPSLLLKALNSIYLQSYANVEAVIVNDGGPCLKGFLEEQENIPNHMLIQFEENKGRTEAANQGIENAGGEYIAFLDDDDIFYPDHLETLITASDDDKTIVYSDALKAVQELVSGEYQTTDHFLDYSIEHSLKRMLEGNFIPIQCLLVHKDCFQENLFDTELDVLEDWDLLIRLSTKYKFKHIKKITSEYSIRMDKTNTTGNNTSLWEDTRKYINKKYIELVKANNLEFIPTK